MTETSIVITKMQTEHIPHVAGIEADVFTVPWSVQAFTEALGHDYTIFYVALAQGKVAGYCGLYLCADEGEITNVAAAPDRRRQHIAQRLLARTMADAREKGARRIFLEVRSRNEPAIRLYEKAGFRAAGSRKNYYRNPQDDALVMLHEYADI